MSAPSPAPARRRWRRFWLHGVPLASGLLMLLVGFVFFDPLWPAQDMPPAVAQRYHEEAALSARIETFGLGMIALGLVWLLAALIGRWRRPPA